MSDPAAIGRPWLKTLATTCLALVASPVWANETVQYSYDALGRLTNAQHAGSVNSSLNQGYTYDQADNRASVTVTGSPFSSNVRVIVVPLAGLSVIVLNAGQPM